jgi:DNA-binding NarL/FixJ family response regulator
VTEPTPGSPLPSHEHQALIGASFGMTDKQIGAWMYLSHNTVKTYLGRAYKRLGATDRAHAIRLGFEAGLLAVGQEDPTERRDAR